MSNAIEIQVLKQKGSMYVEDDMLVVVTDGCLKLSFGNEKFIVRKNQMALVRRNILVTYHADPEVKCSRIFLNRELVKEFIKISQVGIPAIAEAFPITVSFVNKQLSAFFESLQPYLIERGKVEAPLIRLKLLELLFNLARFDENVFVQLMDLREQFRTDITSTVENNLMNSISLNQLAELSGRSLSSFRRDFLAIYNMPPSQWIRQRRLEKARELLLSTTMTVTDVCYTLGFENLPHFSRLFKSYFGHPPKQTCYV